MQHLGSRFLIATVMITMLLTLAATPGTEAMPHHHGFQGGIAELLAAGIVVALIQQNNLGRRRRSLDSVIRQNVL
ncbi:hypothetical protein JTE90_001356 [Oedothorax gibbosus]|uniref:Uncharacterized protein n=1 Tax=Oedothorax gibbosus TaxID=931172 RepID=A0AAV6VGV6_9ARAC|nr:hypothetical protein JTE90_001356 [Oedothorax gibbosus]